MFRKRITTPKDYRQLRSDHNDRYRPTIPIMLLEFLQWHQVGAPYQWDVQEINGRMVLTYEENPTGDPKIMPVINKWLIERGEK